MIHSSQEKPAARPQHSEKECQCSLNKQSGECPGLAVAPPLHPLTPDPCAPRLAQCCQRLCGAREASAEQLCQQWLAELESGGNVRFVHGDPAQPWYKSCLELVSSRFSVADVQVCV